MQLTIWTYEGPPHVGAMRVATSLKDVHFLLHAPQGDTYADLLFTMIERQGKRPPVTYTTFQARDLGGDTAKLVTDAIEKTYQRFKPSVMLVGDSCTAELLQDQPGALAEGANLPVPVVPLELSAYSRKENWGASETLYLLIRALLASQAPKSDWQRPDVEVGHVYKANVLGSTALGFRCRDDIIEVTKLLNSIGVEVNVVAPMGASPQDLLRIPEADFNVCLYPEVAKTTCTWLERTFKQPTIKTIPLGVGATADFLREIGNVIGKNVEHVITDSSSRLPWYSKSVDSTYLTGKRVFIFADASHAIAAARIAQKELGFEVVGIGTYSRELARDVRAVAKEFSVEALITDDYLEVEARITELQPELVLGTQMERHVAKRLGIACAVISTPAHVQDFPARYSPQMGFEGANVIFDSWVHPLMMGLEEHLLGMFREDFEFNDHAAPSHLAAEGVVAQTKGETPNSTITNENQEIVWESSAEKELHKIPFFVRGKARRNTEKYALESGIASINVETLYEAKAHFAR